VGGEADRQYMAEPLDHMKDAGMAATEFFVISSDKIKYLWRPFDARRFTLRRSAAERHADKRPLPQCRPAPTRMGKQPIGKMGKCEAKKKCGGQRWWSLQSGRPVVGSAIACGFMVGSRM
jgi:hypothetical protein